MTKATSASVRNKIEESIDRLSVLQDKKQQLHASTKQEIRRLKALKEDGADYDEIRKSIAETLQTLDPDTG